MTSPDQDDLRLHWDDRYQTIGPSDVSWFEPEPTRSLDLLGRAGVTPDDSVIDVGGGASRLVDALISRGFRDVTVLDVSQYALDEARTRVGDEPSVTWVRADLTEWTPPRRWTVWHDRAVFHFLTEAADRSIYRSLLGDAVEPGGIVVIATFAPDGPTSCSGLPVRRYSPDDLVDEIGGGREVIATVRAEHRTPAGTVQPFTWVALRA